MFSAAALQGVKLPETRWAVPGLLAEGYSILAGRPKRGKSWLALNVAVAIASGGKVLGSIDVEQGEVLYLGLEDTSRRLQSRLRSILGDEPWPSGLHFAVAWPRLGEGAEAQLMTWLRQHPDTRMVVVDTVPKIEPKSSGRGSLYNEDYAISAALKGIADKAHTNVLGISHTRKAGSADVFDTVSGTLGRTGGADTTIILEREPSRRDGKLSVTGRDVDEQQLDIRWDADICAWLLVGDGIGEEQSRLLTLLRQSPRPLTVGDIASGLGKSLPAAKALAYRMTNTGRVCNDRGHFYLPSNSSNRSKEREHANGATMQLEQLETGSMVSVVAGLHGLHQ